jgi:cytochrome c
MWKLSIWSVSLTLAIAILAPAQAVGAIDEEAAMALAKKNKCLNCHGVDKTKKGPAYKNVALKYKGNPEAEALIIKNITTGPKIKLADGTEETHKVIDTQDQDAIKNLVAWILSR